MPSRKDLRNNWENSKIQKKILEPWLILNPRNDFPQKSNAAEKSHNLPFNQSKKSKSN
jgi:hypothetical protein